MPRSPPARVFVVVIAGNMMLMPGLPKVSRAASVDVTDNGKIIGVLKAGAMIRL